MVPRRKPFYSDHVVRDRLKLRGVTRKDIRSALKNSDTSYPGNGRGNLIKEGLATDGRRLVIVVKERSQHVVVTAWWKES